MRFLPTLLKGVILLEPDVHKDSRGFFLETYHAKKYTDAGIKAVFVQDNHSRSIQGTLRGLHAQLKRPQGKLIRVTQGEIFDVAVDARPDSPTFRQWTGQLLSADNFLQLFIPAGFLHGFCVTSDFAEVQYKCTDFYDATDEIGVRWDDPELKIKWPLPLPQLSERDKAFPAFADMRAQFEAYRSHRRSTGG
jgi:dTDP-4-dehydrorhamnose 3,5-epimerase